MAAAIVVRDGHYPGRALIDAYGNGGFRFAGMSHRGALLLLPSGIHDWKHPVFDEAGFAPVFAEADAIDVLIIGTGTSLVPVPKTLRERFRALRVVAEPMSTGAAVRTFNVLLGEERAVAAALMPVD